MFVLIDKRNKEGYVSESNKEIAKKSGIKYNTLSYYARKKYYESLDIIFIKLEVLKSKQGGKRKKKNDD
jgi:hypothetical protein